MSKEIKIDKRKLKNGIDDPQKNPEYYEELMDEYMDEEVRNTKKKHNKNEWW